MPFSLHAAFIGSGERCQILICELPQPSLNALIHNSRPDTEYGLQKFKVFVDTMENRLREKFPNNLI